MKRFLISLGLAVSLGAFLHLTETAAQAQTQCAPLEMVEANLRESFGELPLIEWDGPAMEGGQSRLFRLYGSTQAGSVTLVVIFEGQGRQIACLAATGQAMRIAPQFKPAEHPL